MQDIITVLSIIGSLIVVLIDKLSKREFYRKLLRIAAIPVMVKKQLADFKKIDNSLTGMLVTKEITIRFFNGVDRYDEKVIRVFAKSLLWLIRQPHVDSVNLDFTSADMPSDGSKVGLLLRLINDDNVTKSITIYKPMSWSVQIPKYKNYIIKDVDSFNKVVGDFKRS